MSESFTFDHKPITVVAKAPSTLEEAFALNVKTLQQLGALPKGDKSVDLSVPDHPGVGFIGNFNFSVPTVYRGQELQTAVILLNGYVNGVLHSQRRKEQLRKERNNQGFPPGYWYMVTLNCPPEVTRDDILRIHPKLMLYFEYHKVNVALASLEHSSIWHIHYAVCCPLYNKNLARDLGKIAGYRVYVSKKVTSLHDYNGLFYYLDKPDDHQKASTKDSILIQRVRKVLGSGYVLDADFPLPS